MRILSRKAVLSVAALPFLAGTLMVGAGAAEASVAPVPTRSAAEHVGVAPTRTRCQAPQVGLPRDWVARGSGRFGTSDPQDLLAYRIETMQVPQDEVHFRIESFNRRIWAKTLVVPDGLGSRMELKVNPGAGEFSDEGTLAADEVENGQVLELWKAGFLGGQYKVLDIGDLDALKPGTVVIFTWLRDTGTCG
jgi:hypothetical protein